MAGIKKQPAMTLSQWIAEYRQQPPFPSLRTMAQELGMSTAYLSELERGVKAPRSSMYEAIGPHWSFFSRPWRKSSEGAGRVNGASR
jgi:transcriptional regulator with XRE-family HTH domain